jgi:hypothetical protein
MPRDALWPAVAVLLAAGCQKAEPTRSEAPPVPTVSTAAPCLSLHRPRPSPSPSPAPAAARPEARPAGAAAPAGDNHAARTKRLLEAAEKGRVSQLQELLQKGANQKDLVEALLDPAWWKDRAALVAFIRFKHPSGWDVMNDFNRNQTPDLYKAVESKLTEAKSAK